MERVTATGPADVARLLRRLAEGIEVGELAFGDETFPVSDDLVAVVESPQGSAGSMVVALHFEWPHAHAGHLAVEHELTHPGG